MIAPRTQGLTGNVLDAQVGYVFPKGQYQDLRAAGLDVLRRAIAGIEPRFTGHVEYLTDWQQCSLLSVESSFCPLWYKPGLLLIGDAVHVMSPVGGVGINYAIQDAVVAANVLAEPPRTGRVELSGLAKSSANANGRCGSSRPCSRSSRNGWWGACCARKVRSTFPDMSAL